MDYHGVCLGNCQLAHDVYPVRAFCKTGKSSNCHVTSRLVPVGLWNRGVVIEFITESQLHFFLGFTSQISLFFSCLSRHVAILKTDPVANIMYQFGHRSAAQPLYLYSRCDPMEGERRKSL